MTTNLPYVDIAVYCHNCGEKHIGEYSHDGRWNEGPIFAVVCTGDNLIDFYTMTAAITTR